MAYLSCLKYRANYGGLGQTRHNSPVEPPLLGKNAVALVASTDSRNQFVFPALRPALFDRPLTANGAESFEIVRYLFQRKIAETPPVCQHSAIACPFRSRPRLGLAPSRQVIGLLYFPRLRGAKCYQPVFDAE